VTDRRGPSGAAPFPPKSLSSLRLPIDVISAGTPLHRVHRTALDPIFFGPRRGAAPTNRFDSATGAFGVLYVASDLAGAVVETLARNPQRRMVAEADITSRAASLLRCRRDLRVVQLHGAGLQRLGLDNAISTGPYAPCGAWSDALFAHPEAPDGLIFRSRHDPDRMCLVIFERPGIAFEAERPTLLIDRLAEVASILGAYGKSVAI
jgi:RES domain